MSETGRGIGATAKPLNAQPRTDGDDVIARFRLVGSSVTAHRPEAARRHAALAAPRMSSPLLLLPHGAMVIRGVPQLVGVPSAILRLTSSQVLRTSWVNIAQSSIRLKIFFASSR